MKKKFFLKRDEFTKNILNNSHLNKVIGGYLKPISVGDIYGNYAESTYVKH